MANDAAEVYDRFFVPSLFEQWTEVMLDAAGVAEGDRVLDVGCGTGVLARAASRRVGPRGEVVGVDPNAGMLTVARRHRERVRWQRGVAEDLPLDGGSVDKILSQFAWMFLDDHRAAASELARVLAPGGAIAVATWAEIGESPGYDAMVALLRRIVGDDAAEALRAPFSIGAPESLRALLQGSFPDVAVTRRRGTARFESVRAWLHTDIRGWTLSGMVDDDTYARLLAEAERALRELTDDAGRIRFPVTALVATSGAPR